MSAERFDVAFCDTCIGGSTVATTLARPGLRAYYLADYHVNPLGVRGDAEVLAALERWVDIASGQARRMVIACNTASAKLEAAADVRFRAQELEVELTSMVDLLDASVGKTDLRGERVCLMGTEYTVSSPVYAERIVSRGARDLVRLAATRTESAIAHLEHATEAGQEIIRAEIEDAIRNADTMVLACTCFPLVADLIRTIKPHVRLLDPGLEIRSVASWPEREGPNHLTLAYSGDAITQETLQTQAPLLFPGWDEIEIVSLVD